MYKRQRKDYDNGILKFDIVILSVDAAFKDEKPVSYTHLDVYKRQDYAGETCVAESCRYSPNGDWTLCPYFNGGAKK